MREEIEIGCIGSARWVWLGFFLLSIFFFTYKEMIMTFIIANLFPKFQGNPIKKKNTYVGLRNIPSTLLLIFIDSFSLLYLHIYDILKLFQTKKLRRSCYPHIIYKRV